MLERGKPLIVRNSPIEFVLSGPLGGRDRVLIKTENAGLDVIALCSQSLDLETRRPPFDPFIAMFGSRVRQVNVVSSMSVPDFRRELDDRKSSLTFAWVGLASTVRFDRIRDIFNRSLPDILNALETGEDEDVEFGIAPIVLACSEAHERRRSTYRAMLGFLGLYALIGLGLLVFSVLKGRLPL